MITREIGCISLLNTSKLADYCINPYVGCEHGCKYCYADSITRRFSNHKEPWGEFVDVKKNALDVLRKEIPRRKRGTVFISSLSDAYQPIEKKYGITRKILEILLQNEFSVCIQTKSSLVTRDIDLLKKFEKCEVGLTFTTLDNKVRKDFEPFSSSVEEKIESLKLLKENGIATYVFFGPFLPYLSDVNIEEYFKTLSKYSDYFYVDKLNLKPGVWSRIETLLEKNYPELTQKWKEIFFNNSEYYPKIKKEVQILSKKYGAKIIFCF